MLHEVTFFSRETSNVLFPHFICLMILHVVAAFVSLIVILNQFAHSETIYLLFICLMAVKDFCSLKSE